MKKIYLSMIDMKNILKTWGENNYVTILKYQLRLSINKFYLYEYQYKYWI